jgi:hypothetical protein
METIEKKISNLIENQFPAYYRENGPVLVAFITEYYKWLESNGQTLYHTRRILDYKDIDETVEQFIIYFKNKFLPDIQFNTETNIKQIIKNSLDLYRAKGTERGIDLLFRLVFGVGAEIYYPSTDLMRLSDGKWKKPVYLEVSLNENNNRFYNKQILGTKTGATAFVEKVVRRTIAGRLIDLLYISAVNGNFETEEVIVVVGDEVIENENIKVIGSLSNILIDLNGVGFGYNVGDIVNVYSDKGRQAKGRITSVSDITGLVTFDIINGGYGFNGNAEVIVSEKVLSLSNVHINPNNITNSYFKIFETLIQPTANISYANLAGNTFISNESLVYTYHPNNSVKGVGRVVFNVANSSTNGIIKVAVLSGNLQATNIFNTGNVISANQITYSDSTATANIIGVGREYSINYTNTTADFVTGDEVYQLNSNNDTEIANGVLTSFVRSVGSNGIIKVANTKGIFKTNLRIRSRSTNNTLNAFSLGFNIGIFDINNSFNSNTGNYVYSSNLFSNATVSVVSQGTGASFAVSNDVLYTETLVDINTDFIKDYANVNLNAIVYGFPKNAAANLTTGTLESTLTIEDVSIGKIRSIVGVNRGIDYNIAPFVLIYQPEIFHYRIKDNVLNISDLTNNFRVGELVEQSSTGARGIVKDNSNSSTLFVERLRFFDANNFVVTSNQTTKITGVESGFTANVTAVTVDSNSEYIGLNAIVLSNTIVGNGSVTGMQVVDSGFGFVNGETIYFENENGTSTGIAVVSTQGKGSGFYQRKGGFLSDQMKLHDGNYYQEYSYEVRSSIVLDKYSDMLKKILHVSGTKFFGALVYQSVSNTNVNITSFVIDKSFVRSIITETGNYLILETGTGNVLETES